MQIEPMVTIRAETEHDLDAVREININAFPDDSEACLVDALRSTTNCVSLVAQQRGLIVGHILFSQVTLENSDDHLRLYGLAPMAVKTNRQNCGIGSRLVLAGLSECKTLGADAVVVLGHPNYYPRFGFRSSLEFGLDSDYDVPADVFMVKELVAGCLESVTGRVHYSSAFSDL